MLYLASVSPARQELLRQIGVDFELLPLRERSPRGPDIIETRFSGELPEDYVRRVCRATVRAAWTRVVERKLAPHPVLAAVTMVHVDRKQLGRPVDRADAMRMLRMLSGVPHRVLSTVAIQFETRMGMASTQSIVRFAKLSDKDIETYVATGEPMDKPGGYAIQGRAAAFITELRGSYSGVMGLPLYEAAELIGQIGRNVPAGTEISPDPVT
jgi:septum formation protein